MVFVRFCSFFFAVNPMICFACLSLFALSRLSLSLFTLSRLSLPAGVLVCLYLPLVVLVCLCVSIYP